MWSDKLFLYFHMYSCLLKRIIFQIINIKGIENFALASFIYYVYILLFSITELKAS